MSNLRQPILAGLIVASIILTSVMVWALSGALIERRDGLDQKHADLIRERSEILRQLSKLNSDQMCEIIDTPQHNKPIDLPSFEEKIFLDASVVWVIAHNTQDVSMGSGFFVSDTEVVTNYHVVENLGPDAQILVAAKGHGFSLGSIRQTGESAYGKVDLAVISLEKSVSWARPLNIHNNSINTDLRLKEVVAAGFPGAVIDSYGDIDDMTTGNVQDLPQLVLTAGKISSNAANQTGTQIISHTAQISQGNSGGPLVNGCGEVVGVNTYIYSDSGGVRMFAIGHDTLTAFLSRSDISYSINNKECTK